MGTLLFLALSILGQVTALAEQGTIELDAKLDGPVAEYSLSADSLADAVAKVSRDFQIPVGIEWVRDRETTRPLTRSWTDQTVRQMLGSIVGAYPHYSFREEHGIIHVFCRELLDDSHNFLNLKIPEYFEARREVGGLINQRLQRVVQNIVSPRNLPPGAGEAGSYTSGNVRENVIGLDLRGVRVREALEELAVASEHKIWVVTFSDASAVSPTGFLRTETLWHPSPFPDTDQPMWDFLAWEQYPPACVNREQ